MHGHIHIIHVHKKQNRPRSVTAKTNELYEELKMNGYSWFGGGASSSIEEDPENPSSLSGNNNNNTSSSAYSAVVDNDADIRKRVQRGGNSQGAVP